MWFNFNEILNLLFGMFGFEVMLNIFVFKIMGVIFDGELFKEKIKLVSKVFIEFILNFNEYYMIRCCI